MELFPLSIFPQGSLASSVITTVWVGIFVVAFFNLRFGWVLSGLVVPGYIVPLLIIKPWAAASVIVEAIVTYAIVRILSTLLSRYGIVTGLFGRDRFFALVLTSMAVRVLFDGWLLPAFGEWLINTFQYQLDYRSNLHSFGLIIISLIANQFWKTGFVRGLVPFIVTITTTFLIVRYGLMELTNFTISNLNYMYEDVAASILASPKAYILLIASAFIASRMNLRYGWEHSGILIPSLLALQWYQPLKILTTFIEAFVILYFASLILHSRLLAHARVEGARKLLLFFNVGFAYKLLLGIFLISYYPEYKATDAYGFGYLLATLIAIKMHDKQIAVRMTRVTLQTSLIGVVAGTLIGFSLTLLPHFWQTTYVATDKSAAVNIKPLDGTLIRNLQEDKVTLYRNRVGTDKVQPTAFEKDMFIQGVKSIVTYINDSDPSLLSKAQDMLSKANYDLYRIEDRYYYLREKQPARGWGIYVIDGRAEGGLLVEVPEPLEEWGTLDVGGWLFNLMPAKGLAIGGGTRSKLQSTSDVLINRYSIFTAFQRTISGQDILQIRGYTPTSTRILGGKRKKQSDIELPEIPSRIWVKNGLPPSLDLSLIRKLLGELPVSWNETPLINRPRSWASNGFAELILNRSSMRSVLARAQSVSAVPLRIGEKSIKGYLNKWLYEKKYRFATRGSNAYIPTKTEDLLFIDEEIIAPIIRLMQTQYSNGEWTQEGLSELRATANAAGVIGYRLTRYRDKNTGQNFLLFYEKEGNTKLRHWGTYVFRLGRASNYIVQVPRPLFEINSFEYGVALFDRLKARAILIGGAHPEANIDGSADLIALRNRMNPFNLASQVILREYKNNNMMVVHSRAFGQRPDSPFPREDILISFLDGTYRAHELHPLGKSLVKSLHADGFTVRLVDGSPETAGYGIGSVPQSLYLQQTQNKQFAILWVSPITRMAYAQQSRQSLQAKQFRALGIKTVEMRIKRFLRDKHMSVGGRGLPPGVWRYLRNYMESQNIAGLQGALFEGTGLIFIRIVDTENAQVFLAVLSKKNQLLTLANLNPRHPEESVTFSTRQERDHAIDKFVIRRAGWLMKSRKR